MIFREETLASEYKFKGRIVNLREDTVTVKNGTSKREIVEHHGGTAAVAVTDEGKVILIRQFRKAFEDVILEIPAGKIEEDDPDPLGTMKRELKEETGYTAKNWIRLSSSPRSGTRQRSYISSWRQILRRERRTSTRTRR